MKNINQDPTSSEYIKILNSPVPSLIKEKNIEKISKVISGYFRANTISLDKKSNCLVMPEGNKPITKSSDIGFGLKIKMIAGSSIYQKIQKIFDEEYLAKKLKWIQDVYKEIYYFSRSNCSYVTDFWLGKYKNKIERSNDLLNQCSVQAVTDCVSQKSGLNEIKNARNLEFINTVQEVQKLAQNTGCSWICATITCPGIFHVNPMNGQRKWDGKVTPLDANEFQNNIWGKLQKRLDRRKIQRFGYGVKEANSSSAIHRHLVIYASEIDLSSIKNCLIESAKSEFKSIRCKFVNESIQIDESNSSDESKIHKISSYLTKTFRKAKHLQSEEQCNLKQQAHSNRYSYRRYGFFGLKEPLKFWGLLRKARSLKLRMKDGKSLSDLVNKEKLPSLYLLLKEYAELFINSSCVKLRKLIEKRGVSSVINVNLNNEIDERMQV